MIPQECQVENTTPISINIHSIDSLPQVKNGESIEIISCTNFKLLSSGITSANKMQQSFNSASTNNTDICILDTNESHYDNKNDDTYLQHLDTNDFTVLNVPSQHGFDCAFDESTEVLFEKFVHNEPPSSVSDTDSDVEVLNDSDWSTRITPALNELEHIDVADISESIKQPLINTNKSCSSTSLKREESTDHDISIEDYSRSSISDYEHLNHSQLLNIVRDQAARIRHLEIILQSYKTVHGDIYKQMDALRLLDLEAGVSSEI